MKEKDAVKIIEILKKTYPDAKCSLDFTTPFEMLVAVCLSAQCTDDRVNKVTPELFKKMNKPEDFANADIKEIENLIHSCGFYRNKAKNLKQAGEKILKDFKGEVPCNMEKLLTIPGVGRKSANVIMLEAFDKPQGIAVDTHCKRISNRLGFSKKSDPTQIEQDLLKVIPKKYYKDVNHLFIWHGRNLCTSQNPKCGECPLKDMCKYSEKKDKTKSQNE